MAFGDVHLVGSMPFDTVEEAMRAEAEGVGDHVAWLPDGEVGDRKNWVGFLPVAIFSSHPQLEEVHRPAAGALRQPERRADEPPSAPPEGYWTFRVKPGEDLRFDDLGYGRIAVESYGVFTRLRAEGVIPERVRFQVCLPATNSAINAFFVDPAQWPQVHRAYADGLRGEMARMLGAIPADDLAIQFDLAWEVVDLAMGENNFFAFWPQTTFEEKFERHLSALDDLVRDIPDETLLGYHWCYGTWGGWPMTAMEDLALCVRLSNEAVRRAPRRVDFVHMPVVKHPDDAFFAPLRDLDVGDTKVYLGLIHHTDGTAGFRERAELARHHLADFGIGSVCGYGRIEPEELPEVLRVHRACAEELRG
jgi:hypothetical protein